MENYATRKNTIDYKKKLLIAEEVEAVAVVMTAFLYIAAILVII